MAMISIKNMMFYGFHGTYEYEREQGQKFYFDVKMETKGESASKTDNPDEGIDAALVYSLVKDVVENKRFQLLQALAGAIDDKILAEYNRLKQVTTTVRKPSLPISGPIDYLEVEVTRTAE